MKISTTTTKMKQIILILIAIGVVQCLKPDEFCYLEEHKCSSNNYAACNRFICPDKYPYDSGNGFCAVSRLKYQDFSMWSLLLRQIKHTDLIDKHFKNFYKFTVRIQKCPLKAYFSFQIENVCVKRTESLTKPRISMQSRPMINVNFRNVFCSKRHSFHCTDNLCTTDKKTCTYTLLNNLKKSTRVNQCL